MPPKAKSQWDFSGELFPTEEMRRVLSVTEITATVRRLLEERVGNVWVTGEISNLRAQSSGHIYFSLKDANAQIACVCFRDDARSTKHLLADGRKVVLKGDLTVYEARGQYQLIITSVELEGVGALQVAFEKRELKMSGAMPGARLLRDELLGMGVADAHDDTVFALALSWWRARARRPAELYGRGRLL